MIKKINYLIIDIISLKRFLFKKSEKILKYPKLNLSTTHLTTEK